VLPVGLSALDFCYLTTTGRTSGDPHRIEIWFAPHQDRDTIFLLSGARERADWVRIVEGADDDETARTLVHDKCADGDDLARWRATALPVAIDLTPDD